MGLTKAQIAERKQKAKDIEDALTANALHFTEKVSPDVPALTYKAKFGETTQGYLPLGGGSDYGRVEEAISTTVSHIFGAGVHGKTKEQLSFWSQGSSALYSTRLLALRALRNEAEGDCARKLRRIDVMINQEPNAGLDKK